ncbi:MAG: tetratricopeptide repeat protein [Cyanophyceae cyanobacterium]
MVDTAETAPETPVLSPEEQFQEGIKRYQNGESIEELIPVFKEVCDRSPKSSAAWTCLSWLYLLAGKSALAVKTSRKAVKLNPQDAQARVNLAAALLEDKQKGVRDHVELAEQIMIVDTESRDEVQENLKEGLERCPDSKGLKRLQAWLFED